MKSAVNHFLKRSNDEENMSSQRDTPTHASNENRGQRAFKKQAFPILSPNSLRAFRVEQHFTLLRLSINEVFNAIKDQPLIRRPKLIYYNPTFPGAEEYCSFHESKKHKTVHCRSLRWYLEELVHQGFLKEYVLIPGAVASAGQPSTSPPTQPQ